jgi:hypothetical protein
MLRRPGDHRAVAGGSAHPLQRGPATLADARLRGTPAARTRPPAGDSTGAELPNRGGTCSGLCTQRRAVAHHGGTVTPATLMSGLASDPIRRTVPPIGAPVTLSRSSVRPAPSWLICTRATHHLPFRSCATAACPYGDRRPCRWKERNFPKLAGGESQEGCPEQCQGKRRAPGTA